MHSLGTQNSGQSTVISMFTLKRMSLYVAFYEFKKLSAIGSLIKALIFPSSLVSYPLIYNTLKQRNTDEIESIIST